LKLLEEAVEYSASNGFIFDINWTRNKLTFDFFLYRKF